MQDDSDASFDDNSRKDDTRLEARITNQHLEALQEVFLKESDKVETRVLLNKEQFIAALDRVVGLGSPEEYAELYDKIDITREGMIDWDKFASHMLLELYEKEDKQRSAQVPNWKALRTLTGPHRETIRRIVHVKSTNKFYTVSKEGVLVTWDSDLLGHKGCKVSTEACRQRDLWVTDFIPLPNANKVAVTFTSKEIGFYDLTASSSKADFACAYMLTGLKHTPFTLDYWYNAENPNQAVLSWGDTGGYVNALFLSSANISVFERSGAMQEAEDLNTLNVQLNDLIDGTKYKTSTFMCYHAHTDWTKQVRYLPNMESFISCSTTWADSMAVGWLEKKAKTSAKIIIDDPRIERLMKFQISQGINAFDYHERLNLLATGCVNNLVCLWNPYVTSKPSGVLRGHMSPVICVQFNKARNQVFSFSKDKVLRIWDVQLQVCIQRIAGVFRKGHDVHSCMYYHDDTYRMFLTFNYQLTFMEMKQDLKDRIFSHDKPVVSALYNVENNQVISADQGGIISVWLLDSGQRIKQITETHKEAEVTCLALDETGTRVLTGGTDGNVKIFDLNGHPYHTLICAGGIQVCVGSVIVLKRSVLAIGFTKNIICFRPHTFKTHNADPAEWKGQQEHTDDILAAAFLPPHTLATGAYNGEIVIWNASSESCLRKLTQRVYVPNESSPTNDSHRDVSSAPSGVSSRDRSRVGTAMSRLRQSRMSRPGSMRAAAGNVPPGLQDDDSLFAITKLLFLPNRRVANAQTLVSCGANGYVRFWNANNCCLLAEFVAHENASSITMATDVSNDWLVTGDTDGMLTVFDISNYAMIDYVSADEIVHELPRIISKWPAHRDIINTIEMCKRNDRTLIITASADCQIGLWDCYGNSIGIFGQSEHWKIEPFQPLAPTETTTLTDATLALSLGDEAEGTADSQPEMKSESSRGSRFLSMASERGLAYPDERAITDPATFRLNIWQRTNLGKAYQEARAMKRERMQPSTIPDLPYLQEVQGVSPCGPFTSVEISSLGDLSSMHKPDFMINPERYFATQDEINMMKLQRQPLLAESLKAPFDERSLFSKSLLEFEQKMKDQHKFSYQLVHQRQSRIDAHAAAEASRTAANVARSSSVAPPSATMPRKRSAYQPPPSAAGTSQARPQRISVSSRSSATSSRS